MYSHILIPLDESRCSQSALEHALKLAQLCSAKVTFLHVLRDPPPELSQYTAPEYHGSLTDKIVQDAEAMLERALIRAEKLELEAETKLERDTRPSEAIIAASKEMDLIVMGSHGRSGISRLLLGSVTENVVRQSEKPVLVVRCQNVEV